MKLGPAQRAVSAGPGPETDLERWRREVGAVLAVAGSGNAVNWGEVVRLLREAYERAG